MDTEVKSDSAIQAGPAGDPAPLLVSGMRLDFAGARHECLPLMERLTEMKQFEDLLHTFDGVLSGLAQDQQRQSITPTGVDETRELVRVLEAFERLPPLRARPKTLLEIAGFPRLESVSSNVLAFFLDPSEEHGLGDLALRSLLDAAGEGVHAKGLSGATVDTGREQPTKDRKRLDIVVSADTFVLGIENKVDARVQNPFQEYWDHLRSVAEPGRETVGVLLHLHDLRAAEDIGHFKAVPYAEFFKALRQNLGQSVSGAASRHLVYLLDFIATLENLNLGTRMDPQLLKF
ncbi:MAG: PD-(D/E)XK nuclease family protein, partial [Verrucomicrobia bacterium]|nr:PD-(D/E)XK nuclease family protein [Verrucomicrobiota bacterium]